MIKQPEITLPLPETPSWQGKRMTFEEFLVWDEGHYAEWVNGEIMLLNTPGAAHQELSIFLSTLLGVYASATKAGMVLAAPFLVLMEEVARHPDVMFIATENLYKILPQYCDGAPDIVVEILSKSTKANDDDVKFKEYEAAGVREYWQFDLTKQQAKFFRLNAQQIFEAITLQEETFVSETLPGFRLKTEWLWNNPLARVSEILREIGAV